MELVHTQCYHCGDTCPDPPVQYAEKSFCCEGCEMVYKLLNDTALDKTYYGLEAQPGLKGVTEGSTGRWDYLDQEAVAEKLIDFTDGTLTRLRLRIPQIHCTSCIWLLENLYRLHPGVRQSEVDFMRKELTVSFANDQLRLRELVAMLAGIGYEPEIRLQDLDKEGRKRRHNAFLFPLGVAGFAFGNIMLLSFPEYLGASEGYRTFFGYLNLLLALPVLFYSSQTFFLSAWNGLKQRQLNIDFPISLGIVVLFSRSLFEILTESGAGYMDSLAGLVFFLLVGKWFQQKTYDRLAFDRDYTAYFPIAATRLTDTGQESVTVTDLQPGDRLWIRNQELIPADALLLSDKARIDYSFVSGESEPLVKLAGERIYGGGRQMGNAIEVQLVKKVSRSYLTQLWNQDAFRKSGKEALQNLTDRISKRFTLAILLVATLAGIYWAVTVGLGMAVNVATAVLIVACPCGLALTLPITLGNSLRILGRRHFYLKNTSVIERMAGLTDIVFDKTGTLTQKDRSPARIVSGEASPETRNRVAALVRTSTHPMSEAIARLLPVGEAPVEIRNLEEIPGQGIRAEVDGHRLELGSAVFVDVPAGSGGTYLREDGELLLHFVWEPAFRQGLAKTLSTLDQDYQMQVLSGDTDRDQVALSRLFPADTPMHFRQSPEDKLRFIEDLQAAGAQVMMVGDGLNDAGALQQSEVGVALTEDTGSFAPACDAILDAQRFAELPRLIRFSQRAIRLVRIGFVFSLAYNLLGLTIAVQGWLTPVVAAVLMPISSLSVVTFGMLSTEWLSRKTFQTDLSQSGGSPLSSHRPG